MRIAFAAYEPAGGPPEAMVRRIAAELRMWAEVKRVASIMNAICKWKIRDVEQPKSEARDNMRVEWDVPIRMDDGVVLRADVLRPLGGGSCPVILSYGPYAKGLAFQEGFKSNWDRMIAAYPEVAEGTSNLYQNWELVDPERWVPDGYACMRVDSRGAGRSPGHLEVWSPREARDFHDCIEWAGTQEWSNSKVGLNGISYYAMNQWHVAGLQPPHLAAICVWEGVADTTATSPAAAASYAASWAHGFAGKWPACSPVWASAAPAAA